MPLPCPSAPADAAVAYAVAYRGARGVSPRLQKKNAHYGLPLVMGQWILLVDKPAGPIRTRPADTIKTIRTRPVDSIRTRPLDPPSALNRWIFLHSACGS